MGAINKRTKNALPVAFRELVKKRDKRLFELLSEEVINHNGGISPDKSVVFEYLDDVVKLQENYRHKSRRSTFKMLQIPKGTYLTAAFDKNVVVMTVDEKNMVKDLSDDEVLPISRAAIKYLGGSKNGYDWFMYDGKKLSEIRREEEPEYLK